jgi:hypothetical protein
LAIPALRDGEDRSKALRERQERQLTQLKLPNCEDDVFSKIYLGDAVRIVASRRDGADTADVSQETAKSVSEEEVRRARAGGGRQVNFARYKVRGRRRHAVFEGLPGSVHAMENLRTAEHPREPFGGSDENGSVDVPLSPRTKARTAGNDGTSSPEYV